MKRIIATTLLIIVGSAAAVAQELPYAEVNAQVEFGLDDNFDRILRLSENLSTSERMAIYSRHKKDAVVPFVVNFILGAGIGSFIQGDVPAGVFGLLGEICGITGVYLGSGLGMPVLFIGSAGLLLGTRIFELIRPFTYAKDYNDRLRASLNLASSQAEQGMTLLTLSFPLDEQRAL